MLTFRDVLIIRKQLEKVSSTWADLLLAQYLLKIDIGRLIRLRFDDVYGVILIVPESCRFHRKIIRLPEIIIKMIRDRKEAYPGDIYIFQSHSNRVKSKIQPVTVTAFNYALRQATNEIIKFNVTSKVLKNQRVVF